MNIQFEQDNGIKNLEPITLTREPQDIFCAGTTLRKAIQKFAKENSKGTLILNARLVPDMAAIITVFKKIGNSPFLIKSNDKIIGAYLHEERKISVSDVAEIPGIEVLEMNWGLFEELWQIIEVNNSLLSENLNTIKQSYLQKEERVYVGNNVHIGKHVILDTTAGNIVIGDNSHISDLSIVRGPAYIGTQTVVKSFSEVYSGCSIGDHCKVGGEVANTVMDNYSNQQHYGFIGASYIGSWVNLAAGTTNSNLKNNYTGVKMKNKKTGMQFLGCVFGDHSKTAIGALIYTGKIIGVGSCVYGTLTADAPSFTNAGTLLQTWVENDIDVLLQSQKFMFARRSMEFNTKDEELLKKVYAKTAEERKDIIKAQIKFLK